MSNNNTLPQFTEAVKISYNDASNRSQAKGKKLGTSFLLTSILSYNNGAIAPMIQHIGADHKKILSKSKSLEKREENLDNQSDPVTNDVLGVFTITKSVMEGSGDTRASLEIVLAALSSGGDHTAEMLNAQGINQKNVVNAIVELRGKSKTEKVEEGEFSALLKYGEDLTQKAKDGKIDPVIGREAETRRVMQVLSRRTKNNPVVVGEPGTGKAQPLYSKILTPTGWTTMGKLKEGDILLTPNGGSATINGIYPQGKQESFTITLSDGRTTRASEGHLWKVYYDENNDKYDILTTTEIIEEYTHQNKKHYIELPGTINYSNNDDITNKEWMEHGHNLTFKAKDSNNKTRKIKKSSFHKKADFLRGAFSNNVVTSSNNDYITVKLINPIEKQEKTINKLIELCHSISLSAQKVNKNTIRIYGLWAQYVAGITSEYPNNENRTSYRLRIVNISDPQTEEVQCIHLNDEEHLYITDNYIVTHNTAIVEGLATKIVAGDCPEQLRDKKIMTIDLASLSAGAKYQGEYEERVKEVLSEISAAKGKIITFIDEIHMIAGTSGDSPMNLSNMLKPMLARGEMRLIGATTIAEYRQFIEQDPALERRFQVVSVPEPSVEDAIGILRGIKEKYEVHHGVRIQDSAIIACVELSKRYINGRFLPDKAIDLMDESSSRLKMLIDSRPEEIDQAEREVRNLEIEEVALKRESDERSIARLEEVQEELSNKREELTAKKAQWSNAREQIESVRRLKEHLSQLVTQSEKAERDGAYDRVADIRFQEIPSLEKKIKEEEEKAQSRGVDSRMITEEVTEEIVSDVVAAWTGIPTSKMNESDTEKVLNMDKTLSERVVGQDEAIIALTKAIKKSRAGVSDPNRPIGSFLFAGPSGTGKALPNNTPILTTKGYKKNGDLQPGDIVYDMDGKQTTILQTHPQGKRKIITITLHDGRQIDCDYNHQWIYSTSIDNKEWKVANTKQLLEHLNNGQRIFIPQTPEINTEEKEYYSQDIPENPFNIGSLKQRKEFIKKHFNNDKAVTITHHEENKTKKITTLLLSIGWNIQKYDKKNSHKTTIHAEKENTKNIEITSIKPTQESTNMTCITVDSPTQSYLAGHNLIVTHNTELSKTLADFLYSDEKSLITYSMEEYSDRASINKLIGSPAGYVGYGDTPGLESVRQRPSSVVLFDELEKADDQVIITLLSILEEGMITLNNGKEVDFTNTVIIFTSNLGAGGNDEQVMEAIRGRLRPEFINRLDAIIRFNDLDVDNLKSVVDIQLKRLEKNMENKKLTFQVTEEAKDWIALAGYQPGYGARPVRRIISGDISEILADDIIRGKITDGDNIIIDLNENGESIILKVDNSGKILEEEKKKNREPSELDKIADMLYSDLEDDETPLKDGNFNYGDDYEDDDDEDDLDSDINAILKNDSR